MAKGHKPKAGSRAFWPRKRAKRIYPRIGNVVVKADKTMPLAFAGYKAGMTQASYVNSKKDSPTQGQTITKAATVLDCPSLVITGARFYSKTQGTLKCIGSVMAEKLSKDLGRKTNLPKSPGKGKKIDAFEKDAETLADIKLLVHTKPKESGIGKKRPELFEIPLSGDVKQKLDFVKERLGSEIKPEDVFKEGEVTDVMAVDKGKGFQGPVKRFGITIRSRKNKRKRRHVGTMGPVTPARVLPGKIPQAGQMGFQARTEYNKKILKIGEGGITPKGGWLKYGEVKGNYILLEGSVPGPKKRLVMLRKALRTKPGAEPIKVEAVFLESQQGA